MWNSNKNKILQNKKSVNIFDTILEVIWQHCPCFLFGISLSHWIYSYDLLQSSRNSAKEKKNQVSMSEELCPGHEKKTMFKNDRQVEMFN